MRGPTPHPSPRTHLKKNMYHLQHLFLGRRVHRIWFEKSSVFDLLWEGYTKTKTEGTLRKLISMSMTYKTVAIQSFGKEWVVSDAVIAKTSLQGALSANFLESRSNVIVLQTEFDPDAIGFVLQYLADEQLPIESPLSNGASLLMVLDYLCIEMRLVAPILARIMDALKTSSPEDAYANFLNFEHALCHRSTIADLFFSIPIFWKYADAQHSPADTDACPESWVRTILLSKNSEGYDMSRFTKIETMRVVMPTDIAAINQLLNSNHETLKIIDMQGCDLAGLVIPDSLSSIASLRLTKVPNISAGLIHLALREGVKSLTIGACHLRDLPAPASLAGLEQLSLSGSHMAQPWINVALRDGVPSIDLSFVDLRFVTVPHSLSRITSLNITQAEHISAQFKETLQRTSPTSIVTNGQSRKPAVTADFPNPNEALVMHGHGVHNPVHAP